MTSSFMTKIILNIDVKFLFVSYILYSAPHFENLYTKSN